MCTSPPIGEILGLRDLRMTKRYAHFAPSHKLKAVNVLAQSYGQSECNGSSLATAPAAFRWQQTRLQQLETPLPQVA